MLSMTKRVFLLEQFLSFISTLLSGYPVLGLRFFFVIPILAVGKISLSVVAELIISSFLFYFNDTVLGGSRFSNGTKMR